MHAKQFIICKLSQMIYEYYLGKYANPNFIRWMSENQVSFILKSNLYIKDVDKFPDHVQWVWQIVKAVLLYPPDL